jgi:hypothetical protein
MQEQFEKSVIVKRKLRNNFTMVPNSVLTNKAISLKAKGLMCYLLSLPDDAEIKKTQLHIALKDGRDAVISAFNELIEARYIIAEKLIDEVLKQFSYIYTIYDEPQIISEEPFLESRYGFPGTGIQEPIYNVLNTLNRKETKDEKTNKLIESKKDWYSAQVTEAELSSFEYISNYRDIIRYIFLTNPLKTPCVEILLVPGQLTWKEFEKLIQHVGGIGGFGDVISKLEVMINQPKYLKGKKSLYLTLKTWLNAKR